jgi:hypothetical protein
MNLFFGEVRELTPEERAAQEQFAARIRRDADPRILRRVERWLQPRLLPAREVPQALRPQKTHFDDVLHGWHVGYLAVREGGEPPHELRQDLAQRVPQAILRDIYRPVRRQTFVERTVHETERDPGGQRALAEAKKGLEREPIPEIESSVVAMIVELRRRRRLRARTWLPYRPDDAPRFHTPQHLPFGEIWPDDNDLATEASQEQASSRAAFLRKWQVEVESEDRRSIESEDDE